MHQIWEWSEGHICRCKTHHFFGFADHNFEQVRSIVVLPTLTSKKLTMLRVGWSCLPKTRQCYGVLESGFETANFITVLPTMIKNTHSTFEPTGLHPDLEMYLAFPSIWKQFHKASHHHISLVLNWILLKERLHSGFSVVHFVRDIPCKQWTMTSNMRSRQ
jgi:hypothetical protein